MAKPFHELRERLLRAGVAPRHVRRYVEELDDHLADLRAEEMRAGRSQADAEAAALTRLGSVDELAQKMIEKRQFQAWSARAPWIMFGFVPVTLLACAWFVALLILWSGWQIFLPGAVTPFTTQPGPIFRVMNLYFQAGRMIYFGAPFFIGWGIGLLAARQRLKTYWPAVSLILLAGLAATAQVHASRPTVMAGAGHVALGFGIQDASAVLVHFLVIVGLTVTPYLIWRLQQARSATL